MELSVSANFCAQFLSREKGVHYGHSHSNELHGDREWRKRRLLSKSAFKDSLEYSSDSKHMVSRLFFTLDIDGRQIGLYVDLKQKVGSSFVDGPVEIDISINAEEYRCLLNYEAFSRAVESYYRGLVGSVGAMSEMGGGKARTRNIIFNERKVASFDISGPDSSSLIS